MPNFLFVYRSEPFDMSKVSPEEMQQSMDRWSKWINQGFTEGWMLDPGDALLPEGRLVSRDRVVTDGPFVESKELVGGFSVIKAASFDEALDIREDVSQRHRRRISGDPSNGRTDRREKLSSQLRGRAMNEAFVRFNSQPMAESSPAARQPSQLVEHFFRHESGRLVSSLSRVFGLRNLDLIEDMVQSSLVDALHTWRVQGVPANPSGWMHRVARNKVVDALRQRDTLLRVAPAWARLRPLASEPEIDDLFLDSAIEDSQLRMIFACCHPALARENQIALTLKSLCGFSNAEIARGLLVSEETVKKRIQRARQQLVEQSVNLSVPAADELAGRVDSVHQCLYLMFNEGYAASSGDAVIRLDLCEEAARLCHLLCGHAHSRSPATFALLALMLFHAARFETRTDNQGRLLLLEDQDRSKWNHDLIKRAQWFLDQSADGKIISTFHLEAGIALLHCTAMSFEQTPWLEILKLYDALIRMRPSPIYHLNRAIVVTHLEGPTAGLRAIESLTSDPSLQRYHLVDATLGELYRRAGKLSLAREHLTRTRDATQSTSERELLDRRLAACEIGPEA